MTIKLYTHALIRYKIKETTRMIVHARPSIFEVLLHNFCV